jgi:DMSO/TMAO reductase YedYZ molybdopterin-dependent catalytic subunit
MHILVTEMAGKPLTQLHGAPLRLHAPIKYGYKQIKRIGLIAYTVHKPDDYWTNCITSSASSSLC